MSYRDDVDTLYTRAMVLQRELDTARVRLEERERELARLRGTTFEREHASPGLTAIRELPDPDAVLARLVDTSRREAAARETDRVSPETFGGLPRPPDAAVELDIDIDVDVVPTWAQLVASRPPERARTLLEHLRDRVAHLTPEDLALVAKIVDELTDERDGMDASLRARLRWLASEIALASGR